MIYEFLLQNFLVLCLQAEIDTIGTPKFGCLLILPGSASVGQGHIPQGRCSLESTGRRAVPAYFLVRYYAIGQWRGIDMCIPIQSSGRGVFPADHTNVVSLALSKYKKGHPIFWLLQSFFNLL